MKLKQHFPNALLLESTDADSPQNSFSILCLKPISEFIVKQGQANISYPSGQTEKIDISYPKLLPAFETYKAQFVRKGTSCRFDGFFGYIGWDAIPYFENIQLHADGNPAQIADLRLGLYQILIVFDHYHDEMELIEYLPDGDTSILDQIKTHIRGPLPEKTTFNAEDENSSNIGDERFMEMVALGKKHCFRGDVFQIVPSRQFRRKYSGDDFNLYRSLRAINPSPYLFYFDYGDYRVMGSSPEAQTVINGQEAYIDPIAGTFKRTHDPKKDAALAQALQDDPKETAEHIMLVDLARNDLSRNSSEVRVKTFKEVHYFSHVLHMVSRVTAQLPQGFNNLKVFGDAFPAGTLSGAPKYRALELIDQMENQNRGIYGGALGFFGFDGDVNTAIVIRSFVSQNGVLYSQAGAGVVSESVEESELQEVNNKLGALDKAVFEAKNMNRNKLQDLS